MKTKFTKMHGIGNDYIYFDCTNENLVPDPNAASEKLSDRHFSVGGDGVILILPSSVADFRMRMFNADGSEGRMCGNGIRCVGKFVYDKGLTDKTDVSVETLAGIKYLHLTVEDGAVRSVTVDMGPPSVEPGDIPLAKGTQKMINSPYVVNGTEYRFNCVSMGSAHCVMFLDRDVTDLDIAPDGSTIEHLPLFPERVNVEFVNVLPDGSLRMRVWERGSGETWACGTGACASAVAAVLNGHCRMDTDITVHLRGGDLTIRWDGKTVWMTGPAAIAFEGEVEL